MIVDWSYSRNRPKKFKKRGRKTLSGNDDDLTAVIHVSLPMSEKSLVIQECRLLGLNKSEFFRKLWMSYKESKKSNP